MADLVSFTELLAAVIAILTGIVALLRLFERPREKEFRKIGDFMTAKEFTSGKVGDELCKLLKYPVTYWNAPYLWTERNDIVLSAIKERGKAFVVGASGLGKTRLVMEVLRRLSSDPGFRKAIVIVVDSSTQTGERPIIRRSLGQKWGNVFLFSREKMTGIEEPS